MGVTFSEKVVEVVKLNSTKTIKALEKAIKKVPLLKKTNRVDKALESVLKKLPKTPTGPIKKVPKVVILIINSKQTKEKGAKSPFEIAKKLGKKGVVIVTVSVGKKTSKKVLEAITKNTNGTSLLTKNFKTLLTKKVITEITKKTCEHVKPKKKKPKKPKKPTKKPKKPKKPTKKVCKKPMDVTFVIDSSKTVTPKDLKAEKKLVVELSKRFGVGTKKTNKTLVSVVTFSEKVVESVKLSSTKTIKALETAVKKIPLLKKTTRIDKALESVLKKLAKKPTGPRKKVPKVVVLITNGKQTKEKGSKSPEVIAKKINKKGVIVVTVGVGPKVSKTELKKIGNGTSLLTKNFKTLLTKTFIDKVLNHTCEHVKPKAKKPKKPKKPA